MIDDDTRDRAEIYDLFNRYVEAVAGRQWELLDEVFTEDVTSAGLGPPEVEGRTALVSRIRDAIESTPKTHVLGNYTATIDGDVAEASVRVLGFFRARLVRTRTGWRFRHFGPVHSAITC
jgi:hypothetical protein